MSRLASRGKVTTIDAHVGGAPLRLVVGGAPGADGTTFLARAGSLARRADPLRRLVMHEPRGHRAMVGAMLVDPGPGADVGLVFMDGDGWLPLCGHGVIAAMTIAVERGLLSRSGLPSERAPGSHASHAGRGASRPSGSADTPGARRSARVETLAGTLDVAWTLRAGVGPLVDAVTYCGPSAIVVASSLALTVGARALRADVVDYGGRHLVIDGEASGVALDVAAEADLVRAARRVEEAYEATSLARSSGTALDGVVFVGPPRGDDADVRCGVVHDGVGLDRGPSGGATGALCAVLDAMGAVAEGYVITVEGPSGSRLRASVATRLAIDGGPAIVPAITGTATITGDHVFYADPA